MLGEVDLVVAAGFLDGLHELARDRAGRVVSDGTTCDTTTPARPCPVRRPVPGSRRTTRVVGAAIARALAAR